MTASPDPTEVWAQAYDRLRGLESARRLRSDEVCDNIESDNGTHRLVNGKELINFCSNDYLGLAHHPDTKSAGIEAIKKYGCGTTASRLVCGTLPIHRDLEVALAELKSTEAALVFSSGYLACQGVIQALTSRADDSPVPVYFDRLVHASLIDGATQNGRNWRSFPHNDVPSLEILLNKNAVQIWPSALVITEGIFSMDGDIAPLLEMSDLCEKHHALLLVDDAHGTGVRGERGAGSAELAGIADKSHVIQVGTLSKALGSQGGFVAGPDILRDLMVNTARTFIFDTGLNPAAAGAALEALRIIKDEPERREKLRQNVLLFRKLLNRVGCDKRNPSQIIPVLMAEEERALQAAASLRNQGFFVAAIRPPTVPYGTSRLRITITADHAESDIRQLAQAISILETA